MVLADSAAAHGLGAEDPNRPVAEYLWLGTKHLLMGWDHLLFIAAVVLVSGSLWRATKMLSIFVLGHSITLTLATLQEWTISTTFVDVVIALSVVAVAAAGLRRREIDWRLFGYGLFAFGLIHGLGLSTRLQELGVSDDALMWRVLAFNLGVEIGQALAVLGFAGLGILIKRRITTRSERPRRLTFTTIGVAGLIGAMVLTFPGSAVESEAEAEPTAAAPQPAEACKVRDKPSTAQFAGGGHPEKTFYEPGEAYPPEDFIHVLFDGYVVVDYSADLDQADVNGIRRIADSDTVGVVAGPNATQRQALVATTLEKEFVCKDEADPKALAQFRDEWIAEYTDPSA